MGGLDNICSLYVSRYRLEEEWAFTYCVWRRERQCKRSRWWHMRKDDGSVEVVIVVVEEKEEEEEEEEEEHMRGREVLVRRCSLGGGSRRRALPWKSPGSSLQH